MFQTQQKAISFIKTSFSIGEVQQKEKNYQLNNIQPLKLNDLPSIALDPKRQWTTEEETLIFELHNQHGNKWAIIAEQLKGRQFYSNKRSDNSVKNHFYSRLRKGLRKLNKIINSELKKKFKQFKIIDLYKVIEASDEKFKEIKTQQHEFANFGLDLKNKIFLFAEQNQNLNEETKASTRKLITDLSTFTKDYKRKSKKNRRYSPMGTDSVYRAHIKGQIRQIQSDQKSNNILQHQDIENDQQENESMAKLQKLSCNSGIKSQDEKWDEKKEMKKYGQKQKKEFKKSDQFLSNSRTRSKKSYTHFSQEEEMRNEQEELREQRLDNFAQNILKTFKSYISFKSVHSNGFEDDLFQLLGDRSF